MKKLILILFVIGLVSCSRVIDIDKDKMIIDAKTIYLKHNYMYTVKYKVKHDHRYSYLYIVSSKNRNVGDTLKF